MNHIDLFSGVGGFSLAAKEVWKDEYHNLFFCDNNKFCQAVLRKNFGKESLIYGDIREITEKELAKWAQVELLTAGVPCQPASCAGKRRGTKDDRWLWPETFRIISITKPKFIILENVRGLLTLEGGLVFKSLLTEMENISYETRSYIIPACAVNAPHRRDRVWIIANRKDELQERGESIRNRQGKSEATTGNRDSNATDSKCLRLECARNKGGMGETSCQTEGKRNQSSSSVKKCGLSDAPNTSDAGLQGGKQAMRQEGQESNNEQLFGRNREWDVPWIEVATELCGVSNGLPAELYGLKLSKAGHRVERLKALGNAIVPQVAEEIMRAIKYATEQTNL
jgi:DNA (cytosine-5)-methyltransferase 1